MTKLKVQRKFIYFTAQNFFTNAIRIFKTKTAEKPFARIQRVLQKILLRYVKLI